MNTWPLKYLKAFKQTTFYVHSFDIQHSKKAWTLYMHCETTLQFLLFSFFFFNIFNCVLLLDLKTKVDYNKVKHLHITNWKVILASVNHLGITMTWQL